MHLSPPSNNAALRNTTSMSPSDRHHGIASEFRPAFDAMDADRDGKIGADDLKALSVVAEADIGGMIAAADADRKGYVELEEFERVLGVESGGGSKRRLMKEAFRVMDRDGDGKVGFRDLREHLAEVVGMTTVGDDEVRAMIAVAGGDGVDGGVGFDGLVRILAVDADAMCV